jgi:hypothetical protein
MNKPFTVAQLISALSSLPQDMEVLCGDDHKWFYNIYSAEIQLLNEGEVVKEGGTEAVVLNMY